MTVSEWADKHRKLSTVSSSEPGRWDTSRAEYQRGIMDAISDPRYADICLMTSAQVGKTEILNNVAGYLISKDPGPILTIFPTLDLGEAWSKDRLNPMIEGSEIVASRMMSDTRNAGSSIYHKRFIGGHLTIVGANSPAGLRSRPIRVVLADEVDAYPPSAGKEGDPLTLAIARTKSFWNRKVIKVSTPTRKGFSRIETEWEASDKRRFHACCPHCEAKRPLEWANVHWPEGKPELAVYRCPECQLDWSEGDRYSAIQRGEWIATAPYRGVVGFHLNELCSPFVKIVEIAASFLKARASAETRRAWVNTVLGEPFEDEGQRVDYHVLLERLEDFGELTDVGHRPPKEALLVTCGVDVQGNRLECERVAWGIDEENWSCDYKVFWGDPSDPGLWRQLDAYLMTPTIRADGRELPVRTTCIDSGGHHTQMVYKYARLRKKQRVFAIKGSSIAQSIVWPSSTFSKKSRGKGMVVMIGVTAAKDAVYSHLKNTLAGPGFCHFPIGRPVVYFEQLTSEIVTTKYVRGFPTRVYELEQGRRNEALDCRAYAYAALQSLNIRWGTEKATDVAIAPASSYVVQKSEISIPPHIAANHAKSDEVKRAPVKRAGGSSFWGMRRPGAFLGRR